MQKKKRQTMEINQKKMNIKIKLLSTKPFQVKCINKKNYLVLNL